MAPGPCDGNVQYRLARRASRYQDDPVAPGPAPHHAALLRLTLDQYLLHGGYQAGKRQRRGGVLHARKLVVPLVLDRIGHIAGPLRGRSSLSRRVYKDIRRVEPDPPHQVDRIREVIFRLAWKADYDVGGECEARHRRPRTRGELHVVIAAVASVHAFQHSVGTRLDRQVQVLAHLGHGCHDLQYVFRQVPRVAGLELDAADTIHGGYLLQQAGESRMHAQVASIGVDVLAEQDDFQHTFSTEPVDH